MILKIYFINIVIYNIVYMGVLKILVINFIKFICVFVKLDLFHE